MALGYKRSPRPADRRWAAAEADWTRREQGLPPAQMRLSRQMRRQWMLSVRRQIRKQNERYYRQQRIEALTAASPAVKRAA